MERNFSLPSSWSLKGYEIKEHSHLVTHTQVNNWSLQTSNFRLKIIT